MNQVLLGEGPQYALLYVSLLKKLSRTEPTQGVLVMISDALAGEYCGGKKGDEWERRLMVHKITMNVLCCSCALRNRIQNYRTGLSLRESAIHTSSSILELESPSALDSEDEFVRLKSAQLLTALLTLPSSSTPPPSHIISPLLHKLTINVASSSPHAQDISLQCLAALLALRSSRALAWESRESVQALVKLLRGPPSPSPQTAYLAGYSLWLMSFDEQVAKGINKEFDVVPVLVGIAQGAGKEKVIRVIIATFRVSLQTLAIT